MILENRAMMLFYFQLIAAIVNILLNLLLIPRLGIVGSALATLISVLGRNHDSCPLCKTAARGIGNARQGIDFFSDAPSVSGNEKWLVNGQRKLVTGAPQALEGYFGDIIWSALISDAEQGTPRAGRTSTSTGMGST